MVVRRLIVSVFLVTFLRPYLQCCRYEKPLGWLQSILRLHLSDHLCFCLCFCLFLFFPVLFGAPPPKPNALGRSTYGTSYCLCIFSTMALNSIKRSLKRSISSCFCRRSNMYVSCSPSTYFFLLSLRTRGLNVSKDVTISVILFTSR